MKRIGAGILWLLGIYFVVRALAEPFVIDLNEPATYRDDWGGPHLAGVLLVHCGLGVVAASLMAWRLMRRSAKRLRPPIRPDRSDRRVSRDDRPAAGERRSGNAQHAGWDSAAVADAPQPLLSRG